MKRKKRADPTRYIGTYVRKGAEGQPSKWQIVYSINGKRKTLYAKTDKEIEAVERKAKKLVQDALDKPEVKEISKEEFTEKVQSNLPNNVLSSSDILAKLSGDYKDPQEYLRIAYFLTINSILTTEPSEHRQLLKTIPSIISSAKSLFDLTEFIERLEEQEKFTQEVIGQLNDNATIEQFESEDVEAGELADRSFDSDDV